MRLARFANDAITTAPRERPLHFQPYGFQQRLLYSTRGFESAQFIRFINTNLPTWGTPKKLRRTFATKVATGTLRAGDRRVQCFRLQHASLRRDISANLHGPYALEIDESPAKEAPVVFAQEDRSRWEEFNLDLNTPEVVGISLLSGTTFEDSLRQRRSWTRRFHDALATPMAKVSHSEEQYPWEQQPQMRLLLENLVRDTASVPSKKFARVQEAMETWAASLERLRQQDCEHIMLLALKTAPSLAPAILRFLYSIHGQSSFGDRVESSELPDHVIADSLEYLVALIADREYYMGHAFSRPISSYSDLDVKDVIETIFEVASHFTGRPSCLTSRTIRLLLRWTNLQEGHSLFTLLLSSCPRIGADSAEAFAYFFAMQGEYESALEACQAYVDAGGNPSTFRIRQVANWIIRKSVTSRRHGYADNVNIVRELRNMGIEMDLHMLTSLMTNAFSAKDHDVALRVFALIKEQDMAVDTYVLGAVLSGLRTYGDSQLLQDALCTGWRAVKETGDERLARTCLEAQLYRYRPEIDAARNDADRREIAAKASYDIERAFRLVYDATPLDLLKLAQLPGSGPGSEDPHDRPSYWDCIPRTSMYPSGFAFSTVLQAHLGEQYFSLHLGGARGVVPRLYGRWYQALTQGHIDGVEVERWTREMFIKQAMEPEIWGIFMHALGRRQANVQMVVSIFKLLDMGTLSLDAPSGAIEIQLPTPDLRIWSILLNAFARHGHVEAAEKTMQLMIERDITPDDVAWCTLIISYTQANRLRELMNVLRRREAAGFPADDPGVVKALNRVQNKSYLKYLLHEEARKLKAESGLGTRVRMPSYDRDISSPRHSISDSTFGEQQEFEPLEGEAAWQPPMSEVEQGEREGRYVNVEAGREGDWFEEDEIIAEDVRGDVTWDPAASQIQDGVESGRYVNLDAGRAGDWFEEDEDTVEKKQQSAEADVKDKQDVDYGGDGFGDSAMDMPQSDAPVDVDKLHDRRGTERKA